MTQQEVPTGVHVYTSDGVDVGVVSNVSAIDFTVRTVDGPPITIPLGLAERINTGRLRLWMNSEALRIRYLSPAAAR